MDDKVVVLPETLANQIAAGEVVERPASVVKELVENAIDAGATRVIVETEDAGRAVVRVVDDGEGMSAGDVQRAVLRHATSKIRSAEDLLAIATLGFRGEALPSIASVSRFSIVTRRAGDTVATRLELDGGERPTLAEVAAPVGTRVEVRELFFNVPARLKFLKAPGTESSHTSQLVTSFALGHPHIHFKLLVDGKVALDFPPARRLFDRVVQALGKAARTELHEVAFDGPVRVAGFVGAPHHARASGAQIATFVNGRRVKDRTLQHAIVAAFGGELAPGRFPQAVLYVHLDARAVDVNVHPTKAEVRFEHPSLVHESVVRAIQMTLAQRPWAAPSAGLGLREPPPRTGWLPLDSVPPPRMPEPPIAHERPTELRFGPPVVFGDALPPTPPRPPIPTTRPQALHDATPPPASAPRLVGELRGGRLVAEMPDGAVLLIDPHAVDRARLEHELVAGHRLGALATQPLLIPALVDVGARRARLVGPRQADLAHLGLWVEAFGGATFQVLGLPVPLALALASPSAVLEAIVGVLEKDPRAEPPQLLRAAARAGALAPGARPDPPHLHALIAFAARAETPAPPGVWRIEARELADRFRG